MKQASELECKREKHKLKDEADKYYIKTKLISDENKRIERKLKAKVNKRKDFEFKLSKLKVQDS